MKTHAHFLLRSGEAGLPVFMRKWLSGSEVQSNEQCCPDTPGWRRLLKHADPLHI